MLASTTAVMMAAVAPAQLDAHNVNMEYRTAGSEVDADGDEENEISFPMKNAPTSEIQEEMEISDGIAGCDNQEYNVLRDKKDADTAPILPNGRVERDAEVFEEDLSELEEGEDDSSGKSSSDGGSAAVEEWEGGSEGLEEASVEVANRNNCVSVSLLSCMIFEKLRSLQVLRSG